MSAADGRASNYEIRVAGTLGEGLVQALPGMRVTEVRPCALLWIEVSDERWDAADIVALLGERGHSVTSVRRCGVGAERAPGA